MYFFLAIFAMMDLVVKFFFVFSLVLYFMLSIGTRTCLGARRECNDCIRDVRHSTP
jgi:hypothetical protein